MLFVLGAVRDMRPAELRAVERAAKGLELSTAGAPSGRKFRANRGMEDGNGSWEY